MKLDNKLHYTIFDLLECYKTMRGDRVRQTLFGVLINILADEFDSDEVYQRYSLVINNDVLTFTCHVSIDDEDEADEDDKIYVINARTGRYYVG